MTQSLPHILMVDDEAAILSSFRRSLHRRAFQIHTAESAKAGLDMLQDSGIDYAVVVSDQQMPGMDGISFLEQVRKLAPHATRIMLTGNADQDTAIRAVNHGAIFRFLCKPCEIADLEAALAAGARQYQLVTAEKTLLEKTLVGSVSVMTDVLSLSDPDSYRHVTRMRDWANIVAPHIPEAKPWVLKTAIMLSRLGHVLLPLELRMRLHMGEPLTEAERAIVDDAPQAAHDLLQNIPHFAEVATAIRYQRRGYDGSGVPADGPRGAELPLVARILHILGDLCDIAAGRALKKEFVATLARNPASYDPKLLPLIAGKLLTRLDEPDDGELDVRVGQLQEGDLLVGDVMTAEGKLLLAAGHQMTDTFIAKIRQFHKLYRVREPIAIKRGGVTTELCA